MTFGLVLAVILLGLLLIFLEIFFIPGTTLFGVVGACALLAGIVMMYSYFGSRYGNISLGVSLVAVVLAVVLGFRVIQSNHLAMKGEIRGRVNVLETRFRVGDKGTTVTELRPNGKALFDGEKVEVFSNGDYIPRNTEVSISKITRDKIFIKPLNA